jgi:hypothetical protein
MAVAIVMSVIASAQGKHGGGRPATTGLEHAEATANSHGQRGIEEGNAFTRFLFSPFPAARLCADQLVFAVTVDVQLFHTIAPCPI